MLDGWKKLRPWLRYAILGVAGVLVLYGLYAAYARYDNGHRVNIYIVAGTNQDGSMYFRCDSTQSTAGVCGGPADHATITVGHRDRVHWTVHSNDGGDRAHDFKLTGLSYAAPFPWVELEMQQDTESESFTAWHAGTYKFFCELPGHEDRGMWGTFVVN